MTRYVYVPCYSSDENQGALAFVMELTPGFVQLCHRLAEQVKQMKGDNVYCIEAWEYGYGVLDEDLWEEYEEMGLEYGGAPVYADHGVPREHCISVDIPTIKVTDDSVGFECMIKHTNVTLSGDLDLTELEG